MTSPDGVDAVDVRAAVLVDGDEATIVDLDAGGVETCALGHRSATHGDQQQIGLQLLVTLARLDGHGDRPRGRLDAGDLDAGARVDAALAEGPADLLGTVGVLERQETVLELDDRHLDAEGVPGRRELHPDRAGPQHDRLLRELLEAQGVIRADDPLAVELGERQLARLGAGRDDERRRRQLLRVAAVLEGDLDRVLPGDHPGTDEGLHAAALEGPLQALPHLLDDGVLVLVQGLHLDALVVERHAEVRRGLCLLGDLGGLQDRLGRDAAPVQAGPADLVALDERDVEPELRRPERDRVPARAAAEDDDVVGVAVALLDAPAGARTFVAGGLAAVRRRPLVGAAGLGLATIIRGVAPSSPSSVWASPVAGSLSSAPSSAPASSAGAVVAVVGCALADDGDDLADGDLVVDLGLELLDGAGDGGGDLGVDLVGGDLDECLVDLDLVADLDEPGGDDALGDGLAQLRELDLGSHVQVSCRRGSGRPAGRGRERRRIHRRCEVRT